MDERCVVMNSAFTRRRFLTTVVAGAGVATAGPWLAGCAGSKTSSGTVEYWSYAAKADEAAERKSFALFANTVAGARVEKVFVPPDEMTAKVIGSAAARSGPDVFE